MFNTTGTLLYVTDRYKDEVRAFRVDPGPRFTQIAEIPTGNTELERTNPRDLDLSADGKTLYVANTLGHTIAAIDVTNDANKLIKTLPLGGLATDVKISGKWGIVCGQETNTHLNQPETGHGLPKLDANGVAIKNDGTPLGYTPVMSDATKATTFDDIGSEINIFDTTTNQFVFRYVDMGRDFSQLVIPGDVVDLQDHSAAQRLIRGSGPEQMFVRNNLLFVSMLHSDKIEVFKINPTTTDPSVLLSQAGFEFTGGITPEGVEVSPDGIGRPDLSGDAYQVGYYDMAYLQILWSQNETRLFPNPLGQVPTPTEAAQVARGKDLFSNKVSLGGAGCADCHRNGNLFANGIPNDTFQDYNIHEPGVISETTVDGKGPFYRPENDYFFTAFEPPQDVGTPQNFSSRNTKHLRAEWDAVPRFLHHGFAHTLREVLLPPDSPLLQTGERGFNFRTVRTDSSRATGAALPGEIAPVLPTQVPVTIGDSSGSLAGDGKGPIYVSLDSPTLKLSDGSLQIDQLGTNNVVPLTVNGQINPDLAANHIQVMKDTHGKTSNLSAADLDALIAYIKSLDRPAK